MKQRESNGFTLIELLVVITILSILLIMSFGTWRNQIDKARDSQKKTHLQRLKTAFEDYFNDHECYPPDGILAECNGQQLKPYLDKIPCDPVTKAAYTYLPDLSQPACIKSYKIFTHLNNLSDPMIAAIGCNGQLGCGYDSTLNYGVSSGNTPLSILEPSSPAPNPSLNPSPASQYYYCQTEGNCTIFNPSDKQCSPSYINDPNCDPQGCIGIVSDCHQL